MSDLNECILEIKYKPIPQIIDCRGLWAELISKQMNLSKWSIADNRIDIFDTQNKERAFIGFQNAGFVINDSPSGKYFSDRITNLIKCFFSYKEFSENLLIYRLGVRLKACREYKGSFEELKHKYISKYISYSDEIDKIYDDSEPSYIFTSINFKSHSNNYNTKSGPVTDAHLINFFNRRTKFPKVGLYFDIDNWVRPKSEINESQIIKKIASFIQLNWEKFEAVIDLILKK